MRNLVPASVTALLLTGALVLPAGPAQAATGGLDAGFGTGGRVGVAAVEDLYTGAQERIWASGTGRVDGDLAMVQVRVDRNGRPDPSFTGQPLAGWESLSGGEGVPTSAGGAVTSWDLCCDTAAPSSWALLRYTTAAGRPANFGAFTGGFLHGPRTSPNGLPPW